MECKSNVCINMSGEGEINKCFTGELQTEELQKTCLASVMRSKTEKERKKEEAEYTAYFFLMCALLQFYGRK